MGINAQRVLLIRNSNAAQSSLSQGVAEWYATARGLRTDSAYFYLDFDFGDASHPNTLVSSRVYPTNPDLPSGALQNDWSNVVVETLPLTAKSTLISDSVVTVGQNLIQAIAGVISAYAIEALLVCPGVPACIQGPFLSASGMQQGQPVEVYLALAPYISVNGPLYGLAASSPSRDLPATRLEDTTFRFAPYQPNRSVSIPCGRIGWANGPDAAGFSTLGDESTVGSVAYIVTNAIAAEKTDNRSKPHLIGGSNYSNINTGGGSETSCTAANNYAYEFGCTDLYIMPTCTYGCYGTVLPTVPTFVQPSATVAVTALAGSDIVEFSDSPAGAPGKPPDDISYAYTAMNGPGITPNIYWTTLAVVSPGVQLNRPLDKDLPAGTQVTLTVAAYPTPSEPITYFGVCYSLGSQTYSDYDLGGPVDTYTKFGPGAWTFNWRSFCFQMALLCLKAGGSLAFTAWQEPLTTGLSSVDQITIGLMKGFSGLEALYRAQLVDAGNCLSVWGDPLYAPYLASLPRLFEIYTS